MRLLALMAVLIAGAASTDGRHEDLRLLKTQMEQLHPNLFHDMSRAEWEAAVGALDARLDSLSRDQVLVEVMRLVARVSARGRDGHTVAFPAVWPPLYAVRLYLFSDGLFVTAAMPPNQSLVGTRITAINGHPIDDVLQAVEPLVPRDSAATVPLWLPLVVTIPNVLSGLGLAAPDGSTAFTVADRAGRERTVAVATTPFANWLRWARVPYQFPTLDLPPRKTLWLSRMQDDFWWRYLRPSKTLFVQYNQVAGPTPGEVDSLRRAALRHKPARVVIDLRLNGGGNNTRYFPLLYELARKPFNRPNRLFVVIGRKTFSAAGNFATELDLRTKAVFVGEPMGGGINQYGQAEFIALQRLPIPMSVGVSTRFVRIAPGDERLTITPQISAPLRSSDYFGGRDPALHAVVARKLMATAATTTVVSRRGLYRVTVSPPPARAPVSRLHSWQLVVRTRRGAPVTKARIAVAGDMPEHGHGLPTQPRVRELGRGRYLAEGMKFQMGGSWYVDFRIASRRGKDVARFEFELPQG